jgi:hypothetical protein
MNSQDLVAGWCAGAGSVFIGYPLETIKSNLQTSSGGTLWQTVSALYKERGVVGLWRGCLAPMSSAPILMSLSVSTYSAMVTHDSSLPQHAFAGFMSGFSQSLLNLPFEVVKIRMQVSRGKHAASTWTTAKAMVQASGLSSLFPRHAFVANAISMSFGNLVYYSFHEWVQRMVLAHNNSELHLHHRILIGGMTGVCYWILIFPLDLVRTRLLADSRATLLSASREAVRTRGVRGLYAGLLPTVIRAFFTNATFMTTFGLLRAEKT